MVCMEHTICSEINLDTPDGTVDAPDGTVDAPNGTTTR